MDLSSVKKLIRRFSDKMLTQSSFIFYIIVLFFVLMFRNPAMIAVFRKRELKWLNMLDDWEKFMTYKYKKVWHIFLFIKSESSPHPFFLNPSNR